MMTMVMVSHRHGFSFARLFFFQSRATSNWKMNPPWATDDVTAAQPWFHSCTGGTPQWLTHAYHVLPSVSPLTSAVGLIVVVFVYFARRMFTREEMWNIYEIAMYFVSANLTFITLIFNSIWFLGKTMEGICKLLTLKWTPRNQGAATDENTKPDRYGKR